jgi:Uma2 family endonuclease
MGARVNAREKVGIVEVKVPLTVSDADLMRIGESNPGWQVERVHGEVVLSSPAGFDNSRREAMLAALFLSWGREHGYVALSASAGFSVTPKDTLCPDAALVREERRERMSAEQREKFAPFAPDVVAELLSPSDSLAALRRKCERWHAFGAAYVMLLNPFKQNVETWGTPPPDFPTDWSEVLS